MGEDYPCYGISDSHCDRSFEDVVHAAQNAVAHALPISQQAINYASAMRPVIEGIQPFLNEAARVANYGSAVFQQVSPILATLSQLPKFESELGQFDELRRLVEEIYAGMPIIHSKVDSVGWESLRNAFVRWGKFGWAIPMRMPMVDLARAPETLEEADDRCMRLYDDGIQGLIDHLKDYVYADDYFTEAVRLYKEGRYKTCAMVLCALIEGELIMRDPRGEEAEGRGMHRSSKDTLNLMKPREVSLLGYRLNILGNAIEALAYFFKNAKNFDSNVEGELNRHFLMHGMMRKPVGKTTCVKLFALLDLTTGYLFQQ